MGIFERQKATESWLDTGWRDMTSELLTRGGGSAPSLAQYRDGIYLYSFPSNLQKDVFANFHIDHDFKRGSKLYPHIHWSTNTTSTGTVRWGFEYTFALGHGVGSYGTTNTVYVTQNIETNSQYKHFLAEVSDNDAIDGTLIEPDGIILMRVFRDIANDDFPDNVFGFTLDLHYQVDRYSTKNKVPNFYE